YLRSQIHLYYLIGFLVACVVAIVVFAIAAWQGAHVQEAAILRDRIDAVQAELQKALDNDKRLLATAAEASGQASMIARYSPPSPEIKELADKLKQLVGEFTAQVGTRPAQDADGLRIRLAEATIANVEQRYRDALDLVSDDDAQVAVAEAKRKVEQAAKANSVRGYALF